MVTLSMTHKIYKPCITKKKMNVVLAHTTRFCGSRVNLEVLIKFV